MKIKYSDNAILFVNLTAEMAKDYHACKAAAARKGNGKNCDTCTMSVEVEENALCEISAVVEAIERMYIPDDRV